MACGPCDRGGAGHLPRQHLRWDAALYAGFYPGHDFVDILAADVYANDYRQSRHDELLDLAEGSPITLGEVGILPTRAILDSQPQWAWFMTWTTFLTRENEPEAVARLFADPRMLHREAAAQHHPPSLTV